MDGHILSELDRGVIRLDIRRNSSRKASSAGFNPLVGPPRAQRQKSWRSEHNVTAPRRRHVATFTTAEGEKVKIKVWERQCAPVLAEEVQKLLDEFSGPGGVFEGLVPSLTAYGRSVVEGCGVALKMAAIAAEVGSSAPVPVPMAACNRPEPIFEAEEGASPLEISELHSYKHHEETEDGGTEDCTICDTECIRGDRMKRMACGHEFHAVCLDKCLAHEAVCPTCGAGLNGMPRRPSIGDRAG